MIYKMMPSLNNILFRIKVEFVFHLPPLLILGLALVLTVTQWNRHYILKISESLLHAPNFNSGRQRSQLRYRVTTTVNCV